MTTVFKGRAVGGSKHGAFIEARSPFARFPKPAEASATGPASPHIAASLADAEVYEFLCMNDPDAGKIPYWRHQSLETHAAAFKALLAEQAPTPEPAEA